MIGTLRWSLTFLLVTWATTSSAVKSSSDSKLAGSNSCSSKQTCHDCIQTPSCAWCAMPVSLTKSYLKNSSCIKNWRHVIVSKHIFYSLQGYGDKRCFLPHINKISVECPNNYTINPDNEYKMDKYKELTKGSYNAVKGLEEKVATESKGQESSSTSVHTESHSSSQSTITSSTSTTSKQEAVQLYPQEVTLKLRISTPLMH